MMFTVLFKIQYQA